MSAPKSSVCPGPSDSWAKQKDHSTQRSPLRLCPSAAESSRCAAPDASCPVRASARVEPRPEARQNRPLIGHRAGRIAAGRNSTGDHEAVDAHVLPSVRKGRPRRVGELIECRKAVSTTEQAQVVDTIVVPSGRSSSPSLRRIPGAGSTNWPGCLLTPPAKRPSRYTRGGSVTSASTCGITSSASPSSSWTEGVDAKRERAAAWSAGSISTETIRRAWGTEDQSTVPPRKVPDSTNSA